MGSFFYTPPSLGIDYLDPQLYGHISFGGYAAPLPGSGTIGASFGPIYTPPTTFGPIAGPVEDTMPGGFLPGIILNRGVRNTLLSVGVDVARRVIQSQGGPQIDCSLPANQGKLECMFTSPPTAPPVILRPGPLPQGMQQGGCNYQTASGKLRKGKYGVLPNGQLVCVPKKRRMSPCNPDAARRAVRRISLVHGFMRSIEKSMQKACRPVRGSVRRSSGKCQTCRKVRCSC